MLPFIPMKPQGDKRARLQVVAPYFGNGTVLFPCTGCEELLGQMFNFGIEYQNDACVYLTQGLANQGFELPKIHWIEGRNQFDGRITQFPGSGLGLPTTCWPLSV